MEEKRGNGVYVCQTGYLPSGAKGVVTAGGTGVFRLVEEASGKPVWQGTSGPATADEASGMMVCRGDFSAWTAPGRYRIETEDGRSSRPFAIAENAYQEAHRALLKAFYLFRCGMELEEAYAGEYKHGACHLPEAHVHGGEPRRVDAWGGWHDAGDYGKYVGPGAKAAADLLLACELYPQAFARPLPLPETDGITPDVLHECRYELAWMLRMQDSETGGLYHKLSTLRFPPLDVMPEHDTADLYVSPVSAAATGCFAGVMAMAARVYAPFDAEFAGRCLAGAERAWTWLERNPDVPGFRNPPDVQTGEYGDETDADERYWAAAELYRTTGEERYHEAFRRLAEASFDKWELGWADMGGYGSLSYLLSERDKEPELAGRLHEALRTRALELSQISGQDGFGVSLKPQDYIWGSNMVLLNRAMLLLLADRLAGTAEFEDCAARHIHYLFGMNPLGISYVTGFGADQILHLHHRPSEGDGVAAPVPGLVSGGPNKGLHDEAAARLLQGKAPALCFVDDKESYSTNEVTIYWNSPAVFVLSHFVQQAARE